MSKGSVRRWWVLVGGFAVVAMGARARPARACSYALCDLASVAPPRGSIPANAPALVYVAPLGTDTTPGTNVLFTTLGGQTLPFTFEPDPAGAGQFLIHPGATLQVGASYRLIGVGNCGSGAREEPGARFNAAFAVEAPANLPTSIGPAHVFPADIVEMEVPYGSECTSIRHVSTAYYEIPVEAVRPFYALTSSVLKVDGQVWRTAGYGELLPSPYQVCDGDNQVAEGVSGGHHRGELSIHIAGATVDPPPVGFEFDLDCSAYHGPGAPSGSGCALGGGPGLGEGAWAITLALLLLARALRVRNPLAVRLNWRRWPRGIRRGSTPRSSA